jgi:DNA polymerase-1
MKALIDAEVFLYRCAAAAEYEAELQPDVWTYLCRITDAKTAFEAEVAAIENTLPDAEIHLCFGDRTNYRYAVYPEYKSNRRKTRRPAGYGALRPWCESLWPSHFIANVEGDDVLALVAEPGDVIVSRDKDLKTVPGLHLQGTEISEVTLAQADLAFYSQVLTGDAADGYPGCKGVGPVAAQKALAGWKGEADLWREVVNAYVLKGPFPDRAQAERFAIIQARCARILRPGEYDHSKQRPNLWSPPA